MLQSWLSRVVAAGVRRWRGGLPGLLAVLAVAAAGPACFAQSPPLQLSARAAPGGIELLFSSSYQSAGLSIVRTPPWAAGQALVYFNLRFKDGNLPINSGGGLDPFVSAGRHYTYKVVYPNDPTTNGTVGLSYNPACTFAGECPAGAGQPPQYVINCKQPADIYTSASSDASPIASHSTSFGGVGLVFPSSTALTYACVPAVPGDPFGDIGPSSGLCSAFSQTVNVSACHIQPPPPPPPIKTCQVCLSTGRQCVRSGSGFKCVGNAQ